MWVSRSTALVAADSGTGRDRLDLVGDAAGGLGAEEGDVVGDDLELGAAFGVAAGPLAEAEPAGDGHPTDLGVDDGPLRGRPDQDDNLKVDWVANASKPLARPFGPFQSDVDVVGSRRRTL